MAVYTVYLYDSDKFIQENEFKGKLGHLVKELTTKKFFSNKACFIYWGNKFVGYSLYSNYNRGRKHINHVKFMNDVYNNVNKKEKRSRIQFNFQ